MGTIKNILINIEKFTFPIDFMVLDIEASSNIPFILGRPFMKTAKMLVDMDKGQVKVRTKDREVCFKVICIT